jgi:hypothetical protein
VPGCRSTKGLCQTLEIPGAEKPKGLLPRWLVTLQKKDYFCDGQVFSMCRKTKGVTSALVGDPAKKRLFLRWTGIFY